MKDGSAASKLDVAGEHLRHDVLQVTERIAEMALIKEKDASATVIEQRGWRDPEGTTIGELENTVKTLSKWAMRHEILKTFQVSFARSFDGSAPSRTAVTQALASCRLGRASEAARPGGADGYQLPQVPVDQRAVPSLP
ncbi:hypothetical protein [Kitasatospora sp. NPDC059673]|uniref:hypothetical protein n=1 Tax=Kitasatospora sp. NPDC059673 TaxID=3346901 RepID=UPI0036A51304